MLRLLSFESWRLGLYRIAVVVALCGIFALPALGAGCTSPATGLVSWWPGDGNPLDLAGTNSGALQAGATASGTGIVGGAFTFDGTNGRVQIPDSPSLRPTNLTIEAWVRFSSLDSAASGGVPAGVQYIVFKQNTRSSAFEGFDLGKTRIAGGDVFKFILSASNGTSVTLQSTTLISTGVWYHIAGVRGSNFAQLYVNGQMQAQTAVSFAQDYGNFPLWFGSSGQAFWDRRFKGDLDDVSLYSRALSSNEVAAVYSAGAAGKCKNTPASPLLLNVDFGAGATTAKIGGAAVGQSAGDYWNFYTRDGPGGSWNNSGALTNLIQASGSNTAVGLAVSNAPGAWGNGSSDPMYDSYIYPFGVNASSAYTITILSPGNYTLYLYSLDGNFQLASGATNYGTRITLDNQPANPLVWQEGRQYAAYRNVLVSSATDRLTVIVNSGIYGNAIISGLQLARDLAPWISAPPNAAQVPVGSPVTAQVSGEGVPAPGYQWFVNGTPLTNGSRVSGATSRSLTITNSQLGDTGNYTVVLSNTFGAVTSPIAFIQVGNPPAVALNPSSRTNIIGTTAQFSGLATGSPALGYQWFFNGSPLADDARHAGTGTTNLTILNVTNTDAGSYSFNVTNAYGLATSTVASLTVTYPPGFTNPPSTQVSSLGSMASLQISAIGTPPFAYQWKKNGANLSDGGKIAGASTSSLAIGNAQHADEALYTLVATSPYGSATSAPITLVATPVVAWGGGGNGELDIPVAASNAVQIASGYGHNLALRADGKVIAWGWNPSGQANVPANATNTVAIAAGAESGLALQADGTLLAWGQPGASDLPPEASTNIVAIAAGFYQNLALSADGKLFVWGFDIYGSTSTPADATNLVALSAQGAFNLGLRAEGTVQAWGDYRYHGLSVPDGLSNVVALATGYSQGLALRSDNVLVGWGDTFTQPPNGAAGLSNVLYAGPGQFHTIVIYTNRQVAAWGSNPAGQTDVPAYATNALQVAGGQQDSLALVQDAYAAAPPTIWIQPGSQYLGAGRSATLRSRPGGALPRQFQWLLNGQPIPQQTNHWLYLNNLQTNQSGDYQLVLNNPYGAVTSQVQTLNIILPPAFVIVPTNHSISATSNTTFSALATGTDPLLYQWYHAANLLTDGGHYSGTTTPTLVISNCTGAEGGSYTVVVTDPAGSTNSATASLTVIQPPLISTQPLGASVPVGMPFAMSAVVTGTSPAYQWYLNGAAVSGATTTSLNFASVGLADFGSYQLVASNSAGSATSSVAQLTRGNVAMSGFFTPVALIPFWPAPGLSNVIALASGSGYSLALRPDGTVYGWGSGAIPAGVSNLFGIVAIAAGDGHALALRSNGTVFAWGSNTSGQTNVPANLSNVVAVAAASAHSAALRADGTVVVWGFTGRENQTNIPPGLMRVAALSAGGSQTLALREDATVIGWGGSTPLNVPPYLHDVKSMSASKTSGGLDLVLLSNRTANAWSSVSLATNLPSGLTNLLAVEATGIFSDQLAGKSGTSVALYSNGTVRAWANGLGVLTNIAPGITNAVALAGGGSHFMALENDGRPLIVQPPVGGTFYSGDILRLKARAVGNAPLRFQWYRDSGVIPGATNESLALPNAQLGDAMNYYLIASNALGLAQSLAVPVTLVDAPPVLMSQPASGYAYFGSPWKVGASVVGSGPMQLSWFQNGALIATNLEELAYDRALPGHGGAYQLVASNAFGIVTSAVAQITFTRAAAWGNPSALTNAPVDLGSILGISAGWFHTLAIQSNRTVVAWGTTSNGATNVPSGLSNVVAIAGGNYFSLALKTDGTVTGWGFNSSGQTTVPPGATNVIAITAGQFHSLALRSNGTVVGWGGSTAATVPPGLSNVVAVSAGSVHSLALRNDGNVVGWGTYGLIPPHTNAVAISAGYSHSLLLLADGTVRDWTVSGGILLPPPGLSNVVAIAAGGGTQGAFHSVALRSDGTLVVWDSNQYGQFVVPPDLLSSVNLSGGGGYTVAYLNDRSPAFTVQPASRRAPVGTNVVLTALAVGQPTLQYKWLKNTNAFPGQTNTSVRFTFANPTNNGAYQLIASNLFGSTTSLVANLEVIIPPFAVAPLGRAPDGFHLSFTSIAGVTYLIEYKESLAAPNWSLLEQRTGSGAAETVIDPTPNPLGRYYRIRTP